MRGLVSCWSALLPLFAPLSRSCRMGSPFSLTEIDFLFDVGGLALAMVSLRLELVLRGGHWSGLADSFTPSFMKAVVGLSRGRFVARGARVSSGLASCVARWDGCSRQGKSRLMLGGL